MMTTFLISITPKNVHPLMAFILIPVELISVIIRPVSLAIRMFANLAMGHVMIAGFKFATAYPCGG
jgi:F-type H+-transporting ATPase subunit a